MRHLLIILLLLPSYLLSQSFIPGYRKALSGEELQYHAPQPDATVSLLVRSEDSTRYIEWESAPPLTSSPLPHFSSSPLLLLAGIDVNPEDPHKWKVYVNGRQMFTISSPLDTITKTLTWPGPEGSSLVFKTKEVDRYGDFMGYLFCNLPGSMLEPGKPVDFKVVGESAGSRTWFMVFKYETDDKVTLTAEQAVMQGDKGNSQVLRAEIVRFAGPVIAKIRLAGTKLQKDLDFGYNSLYLPVPQIQHDTTLRLTVNVGRQIFADQTFPLEPVKPRTIYLLHHSHNDIGYTNIQTEVEQIQWNNLDKAIEAAQASKDFPPKARMHWCSEVMWAVESYYDQADPKKKEAFSNAVKGGSIELDGLFANELTSLCTPEELDRLLKAGRRISRDCGVELTSAMITDIPGWTWALVPALAHSGVKYLSLGTNRGHRTGDIIKAWGDKPFYWVSPSGEEKVLCWIHGAGYSLFHTGLAYNKIRKRLQEDLVFDYLRKLNDENYPYEEVTLRYNIGSDNGPVDETLPDAVKAWNEKYVTPKIVISTVGEAFSEFEKKYGKDLPEVSGDLTGYWEDGAYSTARETIMNRNNASRLTQAQALWAMYNPMAYPEEKFREAWRNVLLFDEHTWGSWNSISEPDSPFTLQQWEIKKSFAINGDKQSRKLLFDAMISKALGGPAADAIEVINTCSWSRSGIITVAGVPGAETVITDMDGNELTTQALSDGNIAFLAENIPALGSRIYNIKFQIPNPKSKSSNRPIVQPPNHPIDRSFTLESARFIMKFDSITGAISSLYWKNGEESALQNFVDTTRSVLLNEYLYVEGRSPADPLHAKLKDISVTESGPLFTTVKVVAEAPGCRNLTITYTLNDALNRVEIYDNLDKEKVLTPEAVHFAFPVNLPGGIMRYDLAYGHCIPEKDQLAGSNKNFLTMENWLDISGKKNGITVLCPDAPLFEVGKITMDELVYGWIDSLQATQTFYSYVMNNYWETNYAASQEGPCTFSYILIPHQTFDPAMEEKEAIGQRQPLISRKGGGWLNKKESLLNLDNRNLIITDILPCDNGEKVLMTIYNAGIESEIPNFQRNVGLINETGPDGLEERPFRSDHPIPPSGIRYYKVAI